ncbi:hypothetical protein IIB79_04640 [candidate division KSB1 bacterium]|nr:hypothetical protein [candidate division KSB1 bacterium]
MIENIKFCSCSLLKIDEAQESQCMFFSFTERAKKSLSEDFLHQITEGTPEENLDKSGIPNQVAGVTEKTNGSRVFIKQLEGNTYRIPTRFIDQFIRCLFKYLPAFYVPVDKTRTGYYCNF